MDDMNSYLAWNNTEPFERNMDIAYITNSTKNKVKIVAFTDETYIPIAKWWYERMTDLSYTTHVLVLIDNKTVEHFSTATYDYRYEIELVDEGETRKEKVSSLWFHRIHYCLEQLKMGQSLLLTDVDNIFNRYYPLSNLINDKYDMIFALEQRFPVTFFERNGFVVCGGMIFLKATEASIQMMELVLERCSRGGNHCNDQVVWNTILDYDMKWNTTSLSLAKEKSSLINDDLIHFGFDGTSESIENFHANIWDRDFAWRGDLSNEIPCPSLDNWIAMPATLHHSLLKRLNVIYPGILTNPALTRLANIQFWDIFCGTNGTNRDNEKTNALHDAIQIMMTKFAEE